MDTEIRKKDKDVIEINDIQKIRGLEVEDRYNVLEYLVKELLNLKDIKKSKKKRKHSSSDSESSSSESVKESKKKSKKAKKD